MKRREFMSMAGGSGLGLGALAVLPKIATSQDLLDREEGCGQFAVVANRTYGTPRWDATIRTPGTYVIANTYAPKDNEYYYVSIYVQYRRSEEAAWQDVLVTPNYANQYRGATGGARDWIKVEQRALTVCLFLPDRVLYLREGPVQLRHQLRFFDERNRHVEALDATVNPFSATVQLSEGERRLSYGYAGVGQLAVDIYNVYKQEAVSVELAP